MVTPKRATLPSTVQKALMLFQVLIKISCVRVWSAIAINLDVDRLFGTLSVDSFLCGLKPPERKFMTWNSAAIINSIPTQPSIDITQEPHLLSLLLADRGCTLLYFSFIRMTEHIVMVPHNNHRVLEATKYSSTHAVVSKEGLWLSKN